MDGRVAIAQPPIQAAYAKVSLDRVLNKYRKFECDFYGEPGKKTLGENEHGFVAWPKPYIVIADDDEQDNNEEDEDDAPASPPRDLSPPSPPHQPRELAPPRATLAPTK